MHKKIIPLFLFAVVFSAAWHLYKAPVNISDEAIAYAQEVNKKSVNDGDKMGNMNFVKATFGGGCFWGVEAAFQQINGVKKTAVGFMGGKLKNPTYKDVCYDDTKHTEVCQVLYDPNVVTYDELLQVFFESHDPTQINRQGPDVGDQYRTAIYYHNDSQKYAAQMAINKLETAQVFNSPIATEVTLASDFYEAEEYHQQYFEKKGITGHCGYGTGVKLDFLVETK